MKNKRGKTIRERLIEDINYATTLTDIQNREIIAIKALGVADLAVEFGFITYTEWELFITKLFKLM